MFELYLENGVQVDIAPGAQVETVIANAFFVTSFSKKDFTYTFPISATPKMRAEFHHVHNRESVLVKKEYGIIAVLGNASRKGTLRITRYSNKEYEAHIFLSAFSLSSIETPLNEFDRPLSGTFVSQWDDGINQLWPNTPVYFPTLINFAFYDSPGTNSDSKNQPDFRGIINGHAAGILVNTYNSTTGSVNNAYSACPMPCVMEVLKIGIEAAGYKMSGDIMNHPGLIKAWMYSNRALDYTLDIPPGREFLELSEHRGVAGGQLTYTSAYTRIQFKNSSDSIYSLLTDEYTITYKGLYRIRFYLETSSISGGGANPTYYIRKSLNGVVTTLDGVVRTPSNIANPVEMEINIVFNQGDFGGKIWFEYDDPSNSGEVRAVEIVEAEIEMISGDNTLIRFADPVNLKDYLPAIKFGDFLDGIMDLAGLVAFPDERRKILRLDYKSRLYALTESVDFENKPFDIEGEEISPIVDDYLVKYKGKTSADEGVVQGVNLEKTWLYRNGNWKLYEIVPKDFNGEENEIGVSPIFSTHTYKNFHSLHKVLTTLRLDHQGYFSEENGQAVSAIYIGLFEGLTSDGVCPAVYSIAGFNLELETADPDSVLKPYVDWAKFKDKRSRKFTVIFHHVDNLPEPREQIIWDGMPWVWEEMRVLHEPGKPSSVQLKLL